MSRTRKYVFLALLTAAMLILGYVENLIPLPFAIPGVKLGIANIFVLVILVFFRFPDGLLAVLVRQFLSLLMTGNVLSFLLSLAGGVSSFLVMYLFLRVGQKKFSLLGISVAGSVTHVCAQMMAAALLIRNIYVFYYIPVLLISSLFAGIFIGLCAGFLTKTLEKHQILTPIFRL